jgi:hypothetical protein
MVVSTDPLITPLSSFLARRRMPLRTMSRWNGLIVAQAHAAEEVPQAGSKVPTGDPDPGVPVPFPPTNEAASL